MPVSYKYKLIYVHIPKCAGSTIEILIDTNTIEEYFNLAPARHTGLVFSKDRFLSEEAYNKCVCKVPQHFTYRELQCVLSKNIFNTYTKFSTVRHPYTRIVSGYHFILNVKNNAKKTPITDGYSDETKKNLEEINKLNTFNDYVSWLDRPSLNRISAFAGHFETQTSYLINNYNTIAQDITIFKYENLHDCFNFLKPITNFTEIPHARKSIINKTWQDYKTPELEEKIYNFYKEDFLNFDYKCDI